MTESGRWQSTTTPWSGHCVAATPQMWPAPSPRQMWVPSAGQGGLVDWGRYMEERRASTNEDMFTAPPMYYTQFEGDAVRAAHAGGRLRLLLQPGHVRAGRASPEPPETITELDRPMPISSPSRTTTGRSRSLGFNPLFGFYQNTPGEYFGTMFGRPVRRRGRQSSLAPTRSGKDAGLAEVPDRLYGHDSLVKLNAGAGDEFSAYNAFQTRQARDGDRRRMARRLHRGRGGRLNYGTAPMPVDDEQPTCTVRLHQRHHHRHPEGAPRTRRGVGALEVPDHRPRAGSALQRAAQRPVHAERGQVERADARRELRHVHRHLRPPRCRDDADHRGRRGLQDTFATFIANWQAGKVPTSAAGLNDVDTQIDAKLEAVRAAASRDVDRRQPGRCAAPAFPAPTAGEPSEGRRGAGAALVLAFLSPWIVGFSVFLAYPLVPRAYLSFTRTTCSAHRTGSGGATTSTCSATTRSRPAVRTRCGSSRSWCRCRCCSPSGWR